MSVKETHLNKAYDSLLLCKDIHAHLCVCVCVCLCVFLLLLILFDWCSSIYQNDIESMASKMPGCHQGGYALYKLMVEAAKAA